MPAPLECYGAPLGRSRSRVVDAPAPRPRWGVDFTTAAGAPGGIATGLPEGLHLTRASSATFATSATTTATVGNDVPCLGQRTDSIRTKGLLLAPAGGGRASERLYHASAGDLLDGGRLSFEVTFVAGQTPTGYAYSPRLFTTDAGDYAEIDHTTGRLVVVVDGDTWSPTTALSWAQYDVVTIAVACGGGTEYSQAAYAINAGITVDLGASTSVQAALSASTIDLLCNGTSQVLEGWLQRARSFTEAQSASAPAPPSFVAITIDWSSATLPASLTYQRSGTWLLVDNTAQSHLTSYGPDAWGTEVGASGIRWSWFLPGYTNELAAPRAIVDGASGWQASAGDTQTPNAAAGPDGTATIAARHAVTSGNYGSYFQGVVASPVQRAFSVWARAATGTTTWHGGVYDSLTTTYTGPISVASLGTTWQRGAVTGLADFALPIECRTLGGFAATATDVYVDCAQLLGGEAAACSGFNPLPFTAASVGAALASVPGAHVVTPDGWFDVSLGAIVTLAPETALTSGDRYLLYLATDTHLRLRASDRKLVLTVGGVAAIVTGADALGSGEIDQVRVWSRPDSTGILLPQITAWWTGAAAAPVAVPATVYVFSDGTSGGVYPVQVFGTFVGDTSTYSNFRTRDVGSLAVTPAMWFVADDACLNDGDSLSVLDNRAGGDALRFNLADNAAYKANVIGGHAAMRLGDGAFSEGMTDDALAGPCTIYWVWTNLATPTSKRWFDQFTETTVVGLDGAGHLYLTDGSATIAVTPSTAGAYWSGFVVDGANSRIRTLTDAGVVEATGTITTPGSDNWTVGTDDIGTNNISADVLEILFFDRALDGTERAAVEAYLTARYGL